VPSDAYDAFYAFSRAHEDWELDEVALTLVPMAVVLFVIAVRRALDVRAVEARLAETLSKLETLYERRGDIEAGHDASQSAEIAPIHREHAPN